MTTKLKRRNAPLDDIYLSYDGMEGIGPAPPPEAYPTRMAYWRATFQRTYPGLTVAGTIALAATWLSQHYQAPVMLFALLFGMAFHFLHEEGRCIAGIDTASRRVLRIGVALLGAKITIAQIVSLGILPVATVIIATGSTILFGAFIARRLGLTSAFGILSGGAVGICGASAALAISSVLPKTDDREQNTILTVVTVTALSTVAMITYPMLTATLGLSHSQAGIFLGGTIHDVAQVVGAGYTVSQETGDIATYVKLLRVSLLLPVVFAIALVVRRRGQSADGEHVSAPFPWFLIGFAALVALGSAGLLPKPAIAAANEMSRWCLVAAVAALGMKTSFKALIKVGWRPVALVAVETVWIATVVLGAIMLSRSQGA